MILKLNYIGSELGHYISLKDAIFYSILLVTSEHYYYSMTFLKELDII